MSPPIPPALVGTFDAQVYRCACGAWVIGLQPCETCIRLAEKARLGTSKPDGGPTACRLEGDALGRC